MGKKTSKEEAVVVIQVGDDGVSNEELCICRRN